MQRRSDVINSALRSAIDKNTSVCNGGFFRCAIKSSVERHGQEKKSGCVHLYVFVCARARTQRLAAAATAVVDGDDGDDDERELLSMAERRTQSWRDRTSREP